MIDVLFDFLNHLFDIDYYFFTEFATNAVAQINTKQLAERNRGNAPINSINSNF